MDSARNLQLYYRIRPRSLRGHKSPLMVNRIGMGQAVRYPAKSHDHRDRG